LLRELVQVKTCQNQIITIALAGAGVMPGLAKDQADKAGSSSRWRGLVKPRREEGRNRPTFDPERFSNLEDEKGGIGRPSTS